MPFSKRGKNIQYDLNKDNFPKHVHVYLSSEYLKHSNIEDIISGIYTRHYDDKLNAFYYFNNDKNIYLYKGISDNFWTYNNRYEPHTDWFIAYCNVIFKNKQFKILDLGKQRWRFKNNLHINITMNIYDVKNSKKIGGSKTGSSQTSIDYKKLSKKDKRLLAKCGCTKEKESKKGGKVMEDKIIMVKEDDNICSICRDELMFLDKKTELMCGHKFHTDCILRWITRNPTCPNCRNDHSEYIHKNEKKIVLTYNFRNNNNNDGDNEPDNNNTDSINSEQDNLITVGTNSITVTSESEEPVSVTEMEQIQDMIY